MNRISRRSVVGGTLLLPFAALGLREVVASNQASTPPASPGASPMASPSASPIASPEAGAGGEDITVIAMDILYDVTEIRIPANTDTTITLTNEGVLEHDLVLDALDVGTSLLSPGETESIVVNAPAGEYEYHCTVAGHKESGMVGMLIAE